MDTLGERIVYLRKTKKLKQYELEEMLNCDNLSKFERNIRKPNYEILKSIADIFNVSVDWLLNGDNISQESNLICDSSPNYPFNSISSDEIKLLKNFRKLSDYDRAKIEGMIELKLHEYEKEKDFEKTEYNKNKDKKIDE
ncbi:MULTISPECIES: helix-turn-helix domain-containing protein [unclassified Clostridioides]|uniref:helix-turn-helix domain-containing protein n=1 Tax=unclassified Clostridioides TaxID=2635829 RepID=UPI001D101CB8|nr:helix-turn-helix transcriptional regulator [Clostridioides sp. ZZV14-6150]MCC0659622.1 helix-turn-helix transcriptional regulator [Clostridioides sp. ZZV14-6154]MCC0666867.1 helix-turn-helix transcriptional regulator [Clostridioides sp. ZZV14-6153]MCC0719369.1 helix-turn-helix transcriptional regulator [Clostridioides sp. ZZV14-6105]MCC0722984.1 helix-turn-helix transcriptional regulator [Clostridioides sp. ZZV14-6104]MCC0725830.1 helix-turn-helix transcriptional regulator [Clostridioides s